eukprot:5066951-Prymnesium_polylepis.1
MSLPAARHNPAVNPTAVVRVAAAYRERSSCGAAGRTDRPIRPPRPRCACAPRAAAASRRGARTCGEPGG